MHLTGGCVTRHCGLDSLNNSMDLVSYTIHGAGKGCDGAARNMCC